MDKTNHEIIDNKFNKKNIQDEILKKKKGYERLQLAFELFDFCVHLIRENIKARQPDFSDSEVEKLVIERFK